MWTCRMPTGEPEREKKMFVEAQRQNWPDFKKSVDARLKFTNISSGHSFCFRLENGHLLFF